MPFMYLTLPQLYSRRMIYRCTMYRHVSFGPPSGVSWSVDFWVCWNPGVCLALRDRVVCSDTPLRCVSVRSYSVCLYEYGRGYTGVGDQPQAQLTQLDTGRSGPGTSLFTDHKPSRVTLQLHRVTKVQPYGYMQLRSCRGAGFIHGTHGARACM